MLTLIVPLLCNQVRVFEEILGEKKAHTLNENNSGRKLTTNLQKLHYLLAIYKWKYETKKIFQNTDSS